MKYKNSGSRVRREAERRLTEFREQAAAFGWKPLYADPQACRMVCPACLTIYQLRRDNMPRIQAHVAGAVCQKLAASRNVEAWQGLMKP